MTGSGAVTLTCVFIKSINSEQCDILQLACLQLAQVYSIREQYLLKGLGRSEQSLWLEQPTVSLLQCQLSNCKCWARTQPSTFEKFLGIVSHQLT